MWISVEEKLPVEVRTVLLLHSDGTVGIGYLLTLTQRDGKRNWYCQPLHSSSYKTTMITHWMGIPPLPDKPISKIDALEERLGRVEQSLMHLGNIAWKDAGSG